MNYSFCVIAILYNWINKYNFRLEGQTFNFRKSEQLGRKAVRAHSRTFIERICECVAIQRVFCYEGTFIFL